MRLDLTDLYVFSSPENPGLTASRLRDEKLIADLMVAELANGRHNVWWTHPDEVNSALPSFLGSVERPGAMAAAGQM